MMNLAIRGIEADIGREQADSFHPGRHPDLKADFILANPPFNDSDWGGSGLTRRQALESTACRRTGNANYRLDAALHPSPRADRHRRLRHGQRLHVLQPESARATSARPSSRPKPRGLHDRVARPALLHDADSGLSLVLARDRRNRQVPRPPRRDSLHRRAQDWARSPIARIGALRTRTSRGSRVPTTPGAAKGRGQYEDVPGSASLRRLDEIRKHGHVLTPGRYVGAEEIEDDGEPFEDKMARLTSLLREQQQESLRLDRAIDGILNHMGA